MSAPLGMAPTLEFAGSALMQSAPLLLAGLGGIFSERVGVVNIGLEGMMLAAGLAGIWIAQSFGLAAGLAGAVLVGATLGLLHLVLTQRLKVNHIVSGVAINILTLNATTYLLRRYFSEMDPPREASVHGTINATWMVGAALALPVIAHLLYRHTRLGLRMRAVGEDPESVRMAGVSTTGLRLFGLVASGALAGLAGAFLSLCQVGRFSDDMVSGRGFIALAAVICGRWNPLGMAAAAIAFGSFDALQSQLQGQSTLPGEVLRSVPYLFTIAAALLLRPRPPAALGRDDTG